MNYVGISHAGKGNLIKIWTLTVSVQGNRADSSMRKVSGLWRVTAVTVAGDFTFPRAFANRHLP